ncbi:MAG: Xaa-Pro peptidase family protein [Desulfobacteraceae bacterium]|jgi:Xaa-Pro aminopeptidase
MKPSAFRRRIRVLREKLADRASDTAWITQPENRRYLSRFRAKDTQLNESSGSLFINETEALLLTDSRYTTEAEKEVIDFEVITHQKGLLEILPSLLERLGTSNLGFEEDFVTWGLHKDLSKKLKKFARRVRLTPLKGVVDQMRQVKEQAEINAIEASADLMCQILAEVIEGLEPGRTEKEVAWQIEGLAREGGAEDLAFSPIVASGPNGALPHAVPTERKLRPKEPIILDVGVKLDGYCCDMTRTIFLGTPGPKFRKIYRTVREAQLLALQKISPRTKTTIPDSAAREVIADAGFGEYFGHSLGHGVGLATHEAPRLGPQKPVELKRGMVVTVEPGIYIPGKGGVRLEEMVAIEKDGPRLLTRDRHFYDF